MAYVALINKTKRTTDKVNGANPRANNIYGQILRWKPQNNNHISKTFNWEIFVLAGNPKKYPNNLRNGKYSNRGDYEGIGNNQILCADPNTGEVRRFLTEPLGCEVTGLTLSPNYTTMLVGIQHPGEVGTNGHFPNGGNSTPRSTIVQIRKKDGGIIGSQRHGGPTLSKIRNLLNILGVLFSNSLHLNL